MVRRSVFASVVLAAAGSVVLAGCSSGHSVPKVPGTVVDPPIAKVFTSARLLGLVQGVKLPAGFSAPVGSTTSSGSGLGSEGSDNLGGLSCQDMFAGFGSPGFGESSYADEVAVPGDGVSGPTALVLVAYQWSSASEARSFYQTALTSWSRCGAFAATGDDGTPVPVQLTSAPVASVPGVSVATATDLQVSEELSGSEHFAADQVVALDGDTVVISMVLADPGTLAPGDVTSATGLAGSLLSAMNSAQLAQQVPSSLDALGGPAAPRGRYGTGN